MMRPDRSLAAVLFVMSAGYLALSFLISEPGHSTPRSDLVYFRSRSESVWLLLPMDRPHRKRTG